MITAETKNILVEAAWFCARRPSAPARAATCIHTDASPTAIERGADFAFAPTGQCPGLQSTSSKACGGATSIGDRGRPRHSRARTPKPHARPADPALRQPTSQRLLGTTLDPGRHLRRAHRPVPHRARLRLDSVPYRLSETRSLRRSSFPPGGSTLRPRNRPHRRGRPRLRLQPLCQHPPHARHRSIAHPHGTRRTPPSAHTPARPGILQRSPLERPSPARPKPSSSHPRRRHVPLENPLNEEAAQPPALRSYPACSPCSPAISPATCRQRTPFRDAGAIFSGSAAKAVHEALSLCARPHGRSRRRPCRRMQPRRRRPLLRTQRSPRIHNAASFETPAPPPSPRPASPRSTKPAAPPPFSLADETARPRSSP